MLVQTMLRWKQEWTLLCARKTPTGKPYSQRSHSAEVNWTEHWDTAVPVTQGNTIILQYTQNPIGLCKNIHWGCDHSHVGFR